MPILWSHAMQPAESILFSGGAPGAEAAVRRMRRALRRRGSQFHLRRPQDRPSSRGPGPNHEELLAGDVSLEYISRLMHRRYVEGPTLRKVLQTLCTRSTTARRSTSSARSRTDDTVRGGTGWGAEFAKLCNKPLHVFDQDRDGGSAGTGRHGTPAATPPRRSSHTCISPAPAPGRSVENGTQAIDALFRRSFGQMRRATCDRRFAWAG